MARSTDREWEKFGAEDPYYGVASLPEFRRENLDEEALAAFFAGGERHVDTVLQTIRDHLDPGFHPRRVLDFGCGVGRLVIPFSGWASHVTGVDVSESMLAEARSNCDARGIDNVALARSDDDLSEVEGSYDLVHSYIVLQHIPVKRGLQLIERLLDCLEDGGVGALHVTYGRSRKRQVIALLKALPLVQNVYNVAQGRAFGAPQMQMNAYSLSDLFARLYQRRIRRIYTTLTNHSGELGAMLYFQVGPKAEGGEADG
ncbi:MAG: class I SAM-dependent methyltransferase [Rubricoccaceae bacterium]|nr:class I SAM-dependent methyltransferase [Rubricoccaceae bacterium]